MKAVHIYLDMWHQALFPKDDLDKMMRFPMALHLAAIVLFGVVIVKALA